MGTRNLTEVIYNRKTVIAQYGQWDGYLTGQGETISKFLRDWSSLYNLKINLSKGKISFFKNGKEATDFIAKVENCFEENFNMKLRLPELSRDTAANILNLLSRYDLPKIKLINCKAFSKDHLFCEYHYKINLDKETVQVIASGQKIGVYTFEQFKKENFCKDLEEKIKNDEEIDNV